MSRVGLAFLSGAAVAVSPERSNHHPGSRGYSNGKCSGEKCGSRAVAYFGDSRTPSNPNPIAAVVLARRTTMVQGPVIVPRSVIRRMFDPRDRQRWVQRLDRPHFQGKRPDGGTTSRMHRRSALAMDTTNARSPPRQAFVSTHWSLVLAAGHSSMPGAADALETLCRAYWYPLYLYVRRQGCGARSCRRRTANLRRGSV
jgi:hypothetical protein